ASPDVSWHYKSETNAMMPRSSAAKHRDDFLQMAANAGIVLRITPVFQKPNGLRRSFHGSFPQLLRVRLRQAIEREDTHVLGSGSRRFLQGSPRSVTLASVSRTARIDFKVGSLGSSNWSAYTGALVLD